VVHGELFGLLCWNYGAVRFLGGVTNSTTAVLLHIFMLLPQKLVYCVLASRNEVCCMEALQDLQVTCVFFSTQHNACLL